MIERARAYLDPERRGHLDDLKREQSVAAEFARQRLALEAGEAALKEAENALEAARQKTDRSMAKAAKRAAAAEAQVAELRAGRLLELDALKEELRNAVTTLRARGDEDAAKQGDRLFNQLAEVRAETSSLDLPGAANTAEVELKPGDRVRLFAGGQVGTVRELRGRTAVVSVKGKIFHLRADQLQRLDGGAETMKPRGLS